MRSMALDLGTRTIGIAVSDLTGLFAGGVETIRRAGEYKDFARIDELVKSYEVDTLVIGYPKNMNGTIGERGKYSEQFAQWMQERYPAMNIVLWDERLSTVAAEKVLVAAELSRKKRKTVIDKMAAVVILQGYLDSRHMGRQSEANR